MLTPRLDGLTGLFRFSEFQQDVFRVSGANGQYRRPNGAMLFFIQCWGGGGGGGGGAGGTTIANATGGNGGGPGGYAEGWFDLAQLPTEPIITCGAGGASGAGGTTNDGSAGTTGGVSSVAATHTLIRAAGGVGGLGGRRHALYLDYPAMTVNQITGLSGGKQELGPENMTNTSANPWVYPEGAGISDLYIAGKSGYGAGLQALTTSPAIAGVAAAGSTWNGIQAGGAGASGTGGSAGTAAPTPPAYSRVGAGAGGGGCNTGGTGGAGGSGFSNGRGVGGGGGGAGTTTGGAGGGGGVGLVVITAFF